MAISDVYVVPSGLYSLTVTTQAPILLLNGATTAPRLWLVGIRVGIGVTAASGGNSVLFQLYRTSGTASTGGTSVTANAHDPNAPAFTGAGLVPSYTIAPSVTGGSQLWEQELPQTTGSSWEEFPPLGYEWNIPPHSGTTGQLVMMVTSSVSTSTPVYCDLVVSQ